MPRVAALITSLLIILTFRSGVCAQNVPPEAQKHYDAGMTAKKAKNLDEAIFEFRLALELSPDYLDANWALAWTYASLEDRRKDLAVEYFQKVIDLAPGTDKAKQAQDAMDRLKAEKAGPAPPGPAPGPIAPAEGAAPAPKPAVPAPPTGAVVRQTPPCEMNPEPRIFQADEPPTDAKAGDIWISPVDGAEMVFIPAGEFLYGPEQDITNTEAFWIDRTEVTNGQYAAFMGATGYKAPEAAEGGAVALNWQEGHWPGWLGDTFPVAGTTREDAEAYARWAGMRLPTEEEWEKAARGLDGRAYPWGNEWDEARCVTVNTKQGMPLPVGSVPEGMSPWGVLDMAGNVWEWTASPWEVGADSVVIRGGSFGVAGGNGSFFTTFWRGAAQPGTPAHNGGFRCAISAGRVAQQPQPVQPAAQPQPAAPQPVAIPATAQNLVGAWQLKAARKLGTDWQGVMVGVETLEIAADGAFSHTTPGAGGAKRKVTGTWALQGNQLTFTWLKNMLPDGTEKEFKPARVDQTQAELYEGGRTLVLTATEDNVEQAWERK